MSIKNRVIHALAMRWLRAMAERSRLTGGAMKLLDGWKIDNLRDDRA
jgi:hypothetical protein